MQAHGDVIKRRKQKKKNKNKHKFMYSLGSEKFAVVE